MSCLRAFGWLTCPRLRAFLLDTAAAAAAQVALLRFLPKGQVQTVFFFLYYPFFCIAAYLPSNYNEPILAAVGMPIDVLSGADGDVTVAIPRAFAEMMAVMMLFAFGVGVPAYALLFAWVRARRRAWKAGNL